MKHKKTDDNKEKAKGIVIAIVILVITTVLMKFALAVFYPQYYEDTPEIQQEETEFPLEDLIKIAGFFYNISQHNIEEQDDTK